MKNHLEKIKSKFLQSRLLNKFSFALIMAAVSLAAVITPVCAAGEYYPSEPEEWISFDAVPHMMFCNGSKNVLSYVDYVNGTFNDIIDKSPGPFHLVLISEQELVADFTYHLHIQLFVDSSYDNTFIFEDQFTDFSVTETRPKYLQDVTDHTGSDNPGVNSKGTPYTDLIYIDAEEIIGTSGVPLGIDYDIYFSTSEGYIDNTELGNVFLNFLFADGTLGLFTLVGSSFEVGAMYDPDAAWYLKAISGMLDDTANRFLEKVSMLQVHEQEISGMANSIYNEASERFSGILTSAANFVSPAATLSSEGGTSIYAAAQTFLIIYDLIMSYIPPVVLALFSVVPFLAFIAWIFGFGKGL